MGKARCRTGLGIAGTWLLLIGCVCLAASLRAADLLEVKLDMRDGVFLPQNIVVPAGVRIKITLRNVGKTAAEFESIALRKEKVLAPGAQSFVVLAPLRPGAYPFFDDFHLNMPPGVIVAR